MEARLAGTAHRTKDMERALARDVKASKQKGVTSLSKDLLDVIDTLDLASVLQLAMGQPHQPLRGVAMVQSNLLKVLQEHGVRALETNVGDTFDPTVHDADRRVPLRDGALHNTIADVRLPEYEFGDEEKLLLRACKVDVFVEDSTSDSE